MRMSSKFTRLVLAFLCCAMTVSGAKGPGSGNGNGGQDDNGNSGRNGGNAGTTQSGGGGNRGGNQGGGTAGATTTLTGNTRGGGQGGGSGHKVGSLKTVAVPGPSASELNNLIRDKAATIALGKAFFWEMQFGSDGATACATCHFNAGADSRIMNQTDPGLRRVDNNGNPQQIRPSFIQDLERTIS